MSIYRILAIGLIFALATAGWTFLGNTTRLRSAEAGGRLNAKVEDLWGAPLVQSAPLFSVDIPGSKQVRWIMPASSDIRADLKTDYRKKGLLWYPTYVCGFDGAYSVVNAEEVAQKVRVHFDFPAKGGTYDGFVFTVDDRPLTASIDTVQGVDDLLELAPKQEARIHIAYQTRGNAEWRYRMDARVGRMQNLNLRVNTNFRAVDYPEGCLSPMSAERQGNGMALRWAASDLITRQDIGVQMPEKLNPGPLTSRITFFAPVCLLFFFMLVASINILKEVNIHPMHYLFVAAGFFAFHLLLNYMAGLVNIHVAFAIAAAVSVTMVTAYLTAALHGRLPWRIAVAGQLFYLVLFSYSFFLKGITGLTVAIGAVITLAVLMKLTAHVDWEHVFAPQKPVPPPLPKIAPPENRAATGPAEA